MADFHPLLDDIPGLMNAETEVDLEWVSRIAQMNSRQPDSGRFNFPLHALVKQGCGGIPIGMCHLQRRLEHVTVTRLRIAFIRALRGIVRERSTNCTLVQSPVVAHMEVQGEVLCFYVDDLMRGEPCGFGKQRGSSAKESATNERYPWNGASGKHNDAIDVFGVTRTQADIC